LFALFVEKTGWTINEISDLTIYQINSLVETWSKPYKNEDKPSTEEELKRFNNFIKRNK